MSKKILLFFYKSSHVRHHNATWHLSKAKADTSSNNNHMKKVLLKKRKRKKIQKYGGLDQNPHVNKNDT